MDELQSEKIQLDEQQKNTQQRQDENPYDPTDAPRFPGGYTPVGEGEDNTQVEQVDPINVGQVEVTNPQEDVNQNGNVFGSSDDFIGGINSGTDQPEVLEPLQIASTQNVSLDPVLDVDGNIVSTVDNVSDPGNEIEDPEEPVDPPVPPVDPPVDPPVPPVDPPVDPPVPPVDPEDPDPEDPDPEDPDPEDPDPEDPDPEDPDPEDPDPEDPDPEDPDPEDPDPEDPDPEDPDPEDPDPEDPDPEDPSKGNPGNDKEVGNSPWDGETGASDNPGKGKHQDGEDTETNQPPGDSKNDGGQGNNPKDDGDNGGGGGNVPERGQNNGWGNGDDTPPGNSGSNNNAENDETPGSNTGELVDKFLENHSFNDDYDNRGGKPDFEYDNYQPEDLGDMNIPDVPEPVIEFDVPDYINDYSHHDTGTFAFPE